MVEIVGEAVLRNFPLRVWHRQQDYTHDLLRDGSLSTRVAEDRLAALRPAAAPTSRW